jgi:hypothetical protein
MCCLKNVDVLFVSVSTVDFSTVCWIVYRAFYLRMSSVCSYYPDVLKDTDCMLQCLSQRIKAEHYDEMRKLMLNMPDVFQTIKWCDTLLLHHIQTGIWCWTWWSLSAWIKVLCGSVLCLWLLFVQPSNEIITLRTVMYVLYEVIYSLFIVSEFKFGLQRRWRLFSEYI